MLMRGAPGRGGRGRSNPFNQRTDPDRRPYLGQGLGRDRPGLLRAGGERGLERLLVRPELLVALPDRGEELDHRIGDRGLEVAVAGAVELALDLLLADPLGDGEDLDQVGDALLALPRFTSEPESVTALLIFFATVFGSSRTSTVPASTPPVVDILVVGSCRSMIRAPTSGIRCSGSTRIGTEALVEAPGDLAHELDVLALVLAHRDLPRLVGEHVGRLEDRVEEEPAETSSPCFADFSLN